MFSGPKESYFKKTVWIDEEEGILIREYYRIERELSDASLWGEKRSEKIARQEYIINYLGSTWTYFHSDEYKVLYLYKVEDYDC